MNITVNKSNGLKGNIEIPADKSITHRAFMFAALTKGRVKISNFSKERPRQFFAGVSLSENCGIGGQIRRKGGKVVSCPYPRKENRKQGRKSRPNGLTRRILCAVHFPEFAAGDGIPGHRPKDGWYRAGSRCVWFHLLG